MIFDLNTVTLERADLDSLHDVLFDLELGESDLTDSKIIEYWQKLPEDIKLDSVRWGMSDSVVRDRAHVFYDENRLEILKKKEFPIHKIRSFSDLMAVINEENCDMIFGNFYGCIQAFLKMRAKHPELEMSGFDWIDDGKIELREPNITESQRFKIAINSSELT